MGKILYNHKWMNLHEDSNGDAFVVMDGDAVMVFALNNKKELLFIEEKSIAYNVDKLSLPTGGLSENELPEIAANRELQEEIGYLARDLHYIGTLNPAIKYMKWQCHVYLARNLIASRLPGDENSPITLRAIALSDIEERITFGELSDATSIAAIYMVRNYLLQE